jgi:hypothetical protein
LADALAEKVEKLVEEAGEDVEVEREEVDEVAEGLYHRRREPDAHVLVRAEPGDVRPGTKDGEDREENLLADGVPELGREGSAMLLEGVEEVVEGAEEWRKKVSWMKGRKEE